MFLYPVIFTSLVCNLFVSFIIVLTVFIEFLKNLNKQQLVNQRLTKSLEQQQEPLEAGLHWRLSPGRIVRELTTE